MQRCKKAKKAKRVAPSKQGKHINIARRRERFTIKHTNIPGMRLTSGYTSFGHEGDGCHHTRTRPPGGGGGRAQSIVKPRSREANTEIKYRSKQANIEMQRKYK